MASLVMALFAEGTTDYRFLNSLIQRTASRILQRHSMSSVDVSELQNIHSGTGLSRVERILRAAQKAHGYHLLLLHADSDARSRDDAWSERIEPGMTRALNESKSGTNLCESMVPVIPVRMTESWMLADPETLIDVIGARTTVSVPMLPDNPSEVERIADPKGTLRAVLNFLLGGRKHRRRRDFNVGNLYEPLARSISIDRLERVPAFRSFQMELTASLRALHFI